MPCPHSLRGSPDQCSQCIGARGAAVTFRGDGKVLVDGRPANERHIQPRVSTRYQTRGDVMRHRRELAERERASTIDRVATSRDLDDE